MSEVRQMLEEQGREWAKQHDMEMAEKLLNIVRCKDCKYWYNDEYETEGYCDLTQYYHMTADDFCSRGERK